MAMSETLDNGAGQQARRRRVLFAVLSPHLKRDALYNTLWSWEEASNGSAAVSLHKFIGSVCASAGLAAQRLEINRSLVAAMQLDDAALGPDPMQEMLAYQVRAKSREGTASASATSPDNVIFGQVVRGFFDRLEQQNMTTGASCQRYVTDNLHLLRLPMDAEVALAAFVRKRRAALSGNYATDIMQATLHLIYLAACEYYGPVKADELLAEAVAEAERLPESRLFPPRRLL